MTNKQRLLKNEKMLDIILDGIKKYKGGHNLLCINDIEKWFNSTVTITDEEKIILKSLDKDIKYIGRFNTAGIRVLYISKEKECSKWQPAYFNSLFDWIADNEEYCIAELLGEAEQEMPL